MTNDFVATAKKLRILNDVRHHSVGMPITVQQYNRLTPEVLVGEWIGLGWQRNSFFHNSVPYIHCRAADNEESSFLSPPHLRLADFEEGARAGSLGLRESKEDGLSRSV